MQSLQIDEEHISVMISNLKRHARINSEAVRRMLINCAVQLPAKLPLYCLLAGKRNSTTVKASCDFFPPHSSNPVVCSWTLLQVY